jgi:DNA helicase HerA-like ATPase
MSESIYIGQGEGPVQLLPKYGNRHGLMAGATGTGKTVTLQTLAEGFSRIGVPVFLADVKGDLSGMCQAGGGKDVFEARAAEIGLSPYEHRAYPVIFWDVFRRQGHPIRTTVSEMGPLLLSRLLNLNDVQEGVLNVVFRVADDRGLLLLDLKDLRSMLQNVSENAAELGTTYGNVSSSSVGAIQRSLLTLEQQGGDQFFGEPALDLNDFMRTTEDGRGIVSILAADELMRSPRLYATFLLWMLSELFEVLPEVGDAEKPKLVFFFDEAHLLFTDAPAVLVEKVEQVVRLIRSKGVGVYFVTQNPIDIPDTVLGQLSNRVQHALRAYTPRDQKAVRSASETFRANPKFDTAAEITQLGVGVALVSVLDAKGIPTMVEKTMIAPPESRVGPADADAKSKALAGSPVAGKYDQEIDRVSAYEELRTRADDRQVDLPVQVPPPPRAPRREPPPKAPRSPSAPRRQTDSPFESMAKSVMRSAGTQLGREIVRGVLGGLLGGGSRRR